MILDVFDVLMFTNIGGKGLGEKDTNVGRTNVGATNVRPLRGRGFVGRERFLQTLGLSEAIRDSGAFD